MTSPFHYSFDIHKPFHNFSDVIMPFFHLRSNKCDKPNAINLPLADG